MLEEALSPPDPSSSPQSKKTSQNNNSNSNNNNNNVNNHNPAETSLALLSFLQQELYYGGTAAEARFIRLFPLLIQRLFGILPNERCYSSRRSRRIISSRSRGKQQQLKLQQQQQQQQQLQQQQHKQLNNVVLDQVCGSKGGCYYHDEGGWLSEIQRWDISCLPLSSSSSSGSIRSSSSSSTISSHSSSTGLGNNNNNNKLLMDPVVQLLSCGNDTKNTRMNPLRDDNDEEEEDDDNNGNGYTTIGGIVNRISDRINRQGRSFANFPSIISSSSSSSSNNAANVNNGNMDLLDVLESQADHRPSVCFTVPFGIFPKGTAIGFLDAVTHSNSNTNANANANANVNTNYAMEHNGIDNSNCNRMNGGDNNNNAMRGDGRNNMNMRVGGGRNNMNMDMNNNMDMDWEDANNNGTIMNNNNNNNMIYNQPNNSNTYEERDRATLAQLLRRPPQDQIELKDMIHNISRNTGDGDSSGSGSVGVVEQQILLPNNRISMISSPDQNMGMNRNRNMNSNINNNRNNGVYGSPGGDGGVSMMEYQITSPQNNNNNNHNQQMNNNIISSSSPPSSPKNGGGGVGRGKANVHLSMWEYYIIFFLRYPISSPDLNPNPYAIEFHEDDSDNDDKDDNDKNINNDNNRGNNNNRNSNGNVYTPTKFDTFSNTSPVNEQRQSSPLIRGRSIGSGIGKGETRTTTTQNNNGNNGSNIINRNLTQGRNRTTITTTSPHLSTNSSSSSSSSHIRNRRHYHHRNSYQQQIRLSNIMPYGRRIYEVTYKSYLHRYFPHQYNNNNIDKPTIRYDNDHDTNNSSNNNLSSVPPVSSFAIVPNHKARFFLRAIIEFWLPDNIDNSGIPLPTSIALQRYYGSGIGNRISSNKELQQQQQQYDNNNEIGIGLDDSYRLAHCNFVTINTNNNNNNSNNTTGCCYPSISSFARRNLTILVEHLIMDPSIDSYQNRKVLSSSSSSSSLWNNNNNNNNDNHNDNNNDYNYYSWPLPPQHSSFQVHLYNYIRGALRHAPVHFSKNNNSGGNSGKNDNGGSFFHALDLWLVWIEPWNVTGTSKHRIGLKEKSSVTATAMVDMVTYVKDTVTTSANDILNVGTGLIMGSTDAGSSVSSTTGKGRRQKRRILTRPSSSHVGKYNPKWAKYVAANLHFYTVPLAIFLRRAREFDFSSSIEFDRSLKHVRRVLRVYSPSLVKLVEDLLLSRSSSINNTDNDNDDDGSNILRPPSSFIARMEEEESSSDGRTKKEEEQFNVLRSILKRHEKILGEFSPPRGMRRTFASTDGATTTTTTTDHTISPLQRPSLSSRMVTTTTTTMSFSNCQQDMHNLLEEIYLQHRKTLNEQDVFDKIIEMGANRSKAFILDKLIQNAKVIVSFPHEYRVLGSHIVEKVVVVSNNGGTAAQYAGEGDSLVFKEGNSVASPERKGGIITDRGREQILHGTRVCRASEVSVLGDPICARVKSYEITFLVILFVELSNWLNDRLLGLTTIHSVYQPSRQQHGINNNDAKELPSALMLKLFQEGEESKTIRYRFNLRFLGDPRNWVGIYLCYVLLQAVIRL